MVLKLSVNIQNGSRLKLKIIAFSKIQNQVKCSFVYTPSKALFIYPTLDFLSDRLYYIDIILVQ